MSIPINKYVDITSTVLRSLTGERDFAGLVFTKDAMVSGADTKYKTPFDNGSVVSVNYSIASTLFAEDSDMMKFALKYFSYNGPAGVPTVLHIAKYEDGEEVSAFASATEEFSNFGSYTFLGADNANIASISSDNSFKCVVIPSDGTGKDAFANEPMTIAVLGNDEYAAWMPMAWIASVNYTSANAAGTMMYKRFGGETATVSTETDKDTYDGLNVNYIGRVQAYGRRLEFFQRGVTKDGVDIGIERDKLWIKSRIELGWFDLAGSMNRIPANANGLQIVYAMINSVAMHGVENGAILIDKPLSEVTQQKVLTMTGNANALGAVQTNGYFISVKLVEEGDKYVCQYTLVYAKGDHIEKLSGSNILA
jgi:hypothetical protein